MCFDSFRYKELIMGNEVRMPNYDICNTVRITKYVEKSYGKMYGKATS